jgi:hypothetical protein
MNRANPRLGRHFEELVPGVKWYCKAQYVYKTGYTNILEQHTKARKMFGVENVSPGFTDEQGIADMRKQDGGPFVDMETDFTTSECKSGPRSK